MFDTNLMLRSAALLDATETGSAIDFGQGGARKAITIRAILPLADGTSPTCALVIQESDTSAFTVVRRTHTFAEITAIGEFFVSFRPKYRYLRHVATLGGTSPDFGVAIIGAELQGEYDQY